MGERDAQTTAIRFSLLHATYRAGDHALRVRDLWLEHAVDADAVEHIFSYDEDDEVSSGSIGSLATALRNPSLGTRISAVRNWNAAARVAVGSILVVIADDLLPSPGWDASIDEIIRELDPTRAAFVVKMNDSGMARDVTLRHPVISRAYYDEYGLWNPLYTSYGVDNDFTHRAHRRGLVVDGRRLVLDHVAPSADTDSRSHRSMRRGDETLGLYESQYEPWKRHLFCPYTVVRPGSARLRSHDVLRSRIIARSGYLWGAMPQSARVVVRTLARR